MAYNLDEPDAGARFVLDFLVSNHPSMFSVDELVREFSGQAEADLRLHVVDGIADLAGYGLIHQLGDFVFASRAAICGRRLFRD